jgi:hypothetical protein
MGEGDEHEVGSVFNDRDGCSGHSDLYHQFYFLQSGGEERTKGKRRVFRG